MLIAAMLDAFSLTVTFDTNFCCPDMQVLMQRCCYTSHYWEVQLAMVYSSTMLLRAT